MSPFRPVEQEECIHGLEFGCTICSGKDQAARDRAAAEELETSHPFLARYDGDCPGCGLAITAGRDRIVMRNGRARHDRDGCLSEPLR